MIIWLASYPKSGNTFMRSLLSSYYFSKDGNFEFDLLREIQQFPLTEIFQKIGVDIKDKYSVSKNYIKAQEEINKSKNVIFLKTHSSFCKLYNKYNFSDLKNSLGVIYIVRDPRNVVTSFATHNSKSIENTANLLIDDLAVGNENNEVEVYMGSWNFNFNSWKVFKSSDKYFLVKYEDLIKDTRKVFIETLKFINHLSFKKTAINEEKIDRVIEATNFSRMKKMEIEKGFNEAKIDEITGKKINFFNLGPKNNWKNQLKIEIQKKLENKFRKEMLELGYI